MIESYKHSPDATDKNPLTVEGVPYVSHGEGERLEDVLDQVSDLVGTFLIQCDGVSLACRVVHPDKP